MIIECIIYFWFCLSFILKNIPTYSFILIHNTTLMFKFIHNTTLMFKCIHNTTLMLGSYNVVNTVDVSAYFFSFFSAFKCPSTQAVSMPQLPDCRSNSQSSLSPAQSRILRGSGLVTLHHCAWSPASSHCWHHDPPALSPQPDLVDNECNEWLPSRSPLCSDVSHCCPPAGALATWSSPGSRTSPSAALVRSSFG